MSETTAYVTSATPVRVTDRPYGREGNRITLVSFDDLTIHLGIGTTDRDREIVDSTTHLIDALAHLRDSASDRLMRRAREDAAHDAAYPGLRGGYAASYDSLPDVPLAADEGNHFAGMSS